MAYFNKITINGAEIIRPNNFTPERIDIYAGELTLLSGNEQADIVGWKYADMTMQWDALPEAQLQILLAMFGACELTFTDADGTEQTETITRTSAVTSATRFIGPEGTPLWSNVNVSIKFMTAHH